MSTYYFITSKLNNNVLDIEGANMHEGATVISYPRKRSGTDNQLWELVPTGPKDRSGGQSEYFIRSKLNGLVLDIKGASRDPRTNIITWPQKTSGTDNQVWQLSESQSSEYFFISSQLNEFVMDIEGASTEPGTPIISYPRKSSGTENQIWMLVPEDQPAP